MLVHFVQYFINVSFQKHFFQEKLLKGCMIDFITGIIQNIYKCVAFINARRRRRYVFFFRFKKMKKKNTMEMYILETINSTLKRYTSFMGPNYEGSIFDCICG
eukprot:UN15208